MAARLDLELGGISTDRVRVTFGPHDSPLSVEVQMSPPFTHAVSLVPSDNEAMEPHHLDPARLRSIQFALLSVDVQTSPLRRYGPG